MNTTKNILPAPKRRAGALTPLFSVYSQDSIGNGDILDLVKLIDWAKIANLSIIQILPLNITGSDNSPYSCISSFALDPIYLSFKKLLGVDMAMFESDISSLKRDYSQNQIVDYSVKQKKVGLLKKIFQTVDTLPKEYEDFKEQNKYWLNDFVLFQIIKDLHSQQPWYEWVEDYRDRNTSFLDILENDYKTDVEFLKWIQWQLYEQLAYVKSYAKENNVLLMGDIPILVAKDSADVWQHPYYFNLNYSTGAPPDVYFLNGQKWGMPAYDWSILEQDNYEYLVEKINYAKNFYDLFRLDHFIGFFRLWLIENSVDHETQGLDGFFVPEDTSLWQGQGEKIITSLIKSTNANFCAEDLGIVPTYVSEALDKYNIKGIDVQRWVRDWQNTGHFTKPENTRYNAVSVISNHDLSPFKLWWEQEAGKISENMLDDISKLLKIEKSNLKRLFSRVNHSYEWRNDITEPALISHVLEVPKENVWILEELFKITYKEKEKFLEYLGISGNYNNGASKLLILEALRKSLQANSIYSIQSIRDWFSLSNVLDSEQNLKINTPGEFSDENWTFKMPISIEEMQDSEINQTIRKLVKETNR